MARSRLGIQQQGIYLAQVKDTEGTEGKSQCHLISLCFWEMQRWAKRGIGQLRVGYVLWRNKRPVNSIIVDHSNSRVMDQLSGTGEEGVWKEAFWDAPVQTVCSFVWLLHGSSVITHLTGSLWKGPANGTRCGWVARAVWWISSQWQQGKNGLWALGRRCSALAAQNFKLFLRFYAWLCHFT